MQKLIRVVDYTRPWSGNDGNIRPSISYRIEKNLGDGVSYVTIKPAFEKNKSRDYGILDSMVDEIRKIGTEEDLKAFSKK